jgi:hypothetical protein
MVTMTVNKSMVRMSVSVLAMVLSATMALADDEVTTANAAVETEGFEPQVIECWFGFEPVDVVDVAPVEFVDETKDAGGDVPEVTITTDENGEEVVYTPIEPVEFEDGVDPQVYYMSAGSADDVDMVKHDIVLAKGAVLHDQAAHDPAAVPNLCDIAGPGLDWLCGANTQ